MSTSAVAEAGIDRSRYPACLIVWNSRAGDGDSSSVEARRAALEDVLRTRGLAYELFDSRSEEEGAGRVRSALAAGVQTIVAAGGDGTVRSVAFELIGRDAALGILPLGTAMNVAQSLGVPLDVEGAAKVLAAGNVRKIDVGEVRGRPFLEIASIGLGAEVLAAATAVKNGRAAAVLEGLRTAWHYPRTRLRLELDGMEVRAHAVSLAIANGAFTGRGIELAPGASIDDGQFDVLVFRGFGGIRLLAHLARGVLGRASDPRIARYRAANVRVTAHRPLPLRLDSQDLGTTPVELVTRRGVLRVIAP